jgi:hypothetical protein
LEVFLLVVAFEVVLLLVALVVASEVALEAVLLVVALVHIEEVDIEVVGKVELFVEVVVDKEVEYVD